MLAPTDGYDLFTGRNFHVPVIPKGGELVTNLAISPASNDETEPLLLVSAAINWLAFKRLFPATCCAILPASNELMLFTPPVLTGVTV